MVAKARIIASVAILPILLLSGEGDRVVNESTMTPIEILTKGAEVAASIDSFTMVETQISRTTEGSSEAVSEVIQVGRNRFTKATDEGGLGQEWLNFEGKLYSRGAPNSDWKGVVEENETIALGEHRLVAAAVGEGEDDLGSIKSLLLGIKSAQPVLSRGDDALIDGRQTIHLIVELPSETYDLVEARAAVQQLHARMLGVLGLEALEPPDINPTFDEPDAAKGSVEVFIDAATFLLRRVVFTDVSYREDREVASHVRTLDYSDFDEPLQLPGPLPGF